MLDRIERIVGERPVFAHMDIRDRPALRKLLAAHRFDAVIHFAGLKAVGESVGKPLAYHDNNVGGSMALFECVMEAGLRTIMIEEILRDTATTDPGWRIALLRYINPVGAHSAGLIGDDPNGVPSNVMPCIAEVAVGKLKELAVFGSDCPTPDGTGVRDYIHVVDLARGHHAALNALRERPGMLTVNLGTGRGYSVLEVVRAFAAASGKAVPYRIMGRRPGDIALCYADPALARKALGWPAQLGLEAMCADTWRWQQSVNPVDFPSGDRR